MHMIKGSGIPSTIEAMVDFDGLDSRDWVADAADELVCFAEPTSGCKRAIERKYSANSGLPCKRKSCPVATEAVLIPTGLE